MSFTALATGAGGARTPTELGSAVSVAITVGVVFAVVFTALYVLLALQVRTGRSWARIVTWVLAGLSALLGVASLLSPAPGLVIATSGVRRRCRSIGGSSHMIGRLPAHPPR